MSYFFRSFSPQIASTARGFVKVSRNSNLNQNFQFKPGNLGSMIFQTSLGDINVRFLTASGSTPPGVLPPRDGKGTGNGGTDKSTEAKERRERISTGCKVVATIGGALLTGNTLWQTYYGNKSIENKSEEIKKYADRIEHSIGISKNVGLLSLKPLNIRDDEEKIKLLNSAKHEVLFFARTGYYGFSKERDGKPNIVRDAVESLVSKERKIKVVLPHPDLLPELKKQPGLRDKDVEKNVQDTLLEIKEINEKYPHSPQIEVKLTKEILFVTAELIDPEDCDAKVVYIREKERHNNCLVATFAKNQGEGIGYHETADKMLAIWNDPNKLFKYDLNCKYPDDVVDQNDSKDSTILSSSAFFNGPNKTSNMSQDIRNTSLPTNGKK